ncbi:hypothetical protein FACS189481_1290 [Clostridia bacterium]|nr:hypothetical protein FACS189481_1290 [Clostridia bacterium]
MEETNISSSVSDIEGDTDEQENKRRREVVVAVDEVDLHLSCATSSPKFDAASSPELDTTS